jgi:hypothetical protein
MGYYQDRYRASLIFNIIDELYKELDGLIPSISDETQKVYLERLRRVIGLTERHLRSADPEFITATSLERIQGRLDKILKYLQQLKSSGASDWALIDKFVDPLLEYLPLIPNSPAASPPAEYADLLEQFRINSNAELKKLRQEAVALREKYQSQETSIREISKLVMDYQTRLDLEKPRLDAIVSDYQKAFGAENSKRNVEFNEQMQKLGVKFDTEIHRVYGSLSDYVKLAEEDLGAMKVKLEDASRIVSIISNSGMASHYRQTADSDAKVANSFRIYAIWFFAIAITVATVLVYLVDAKQLDWNVALFRLTLAVLLCAPAFYCMRESTRHRNQEHRNRRIELELSSIYSFLDRLPKEAMQDVIKKKSDQYFGNELPAEQTESFAIFSKFRGDDLLKILDRLSKMASRMDRSDRKDKNDDRKQESKP